MGNSTEVRDNAVIEDSVIGMKCVIGANTKISGSYIWNNVIIEDNVTITGAIICDNVIIKSGANIPKGSILDKEVIVKAKTLVPMNVYISLYTYSNKDKAYILTNDSSEGFDKGSICELNKWDQLPDYQHIGGTPYYQLNPTQKRVIEEEEEEEHTEQPAVDSMVIYYYSLYK